MNILGDEKRSFRAKKLIIIESLSGQDYPVAKLTYDQLKNDDGIEFPEIISHHVSDKAELLALLQDIANDVSKTVGAPILHFVMHGNEYGLGLESGELIIWDELAAPLININIATANNLFVTMCSCMGVFMGHIMSSSWDRSVFWSMLGREDEFQAGYFTLDYVKFYKTMLTTNDLVQAGYFTLDYVKFYKTMLTTNDLGKAWREINEERKGYELINTEYVFKKALELFCEGILVDMGEAHENEFRAEAESAGLVLPVNKIELRQVIVQEGLKQVYKWHSKYFMIDLYPDNATRFFTKEQVKSEIDSYLNAS